MAFNDSLGVQGYDKELSYTKWEKDDRNMKERVCEIRGRNSNWKAGLERVQFQMVSALLSCCPAYCKRPEVSYTGSPELCAVYAGENRSTEA